MMDESVRLLTTQRLLEKEADGKIEFFGTSVNETIKRCILNGLSKRADKIKSEFKVPDKRSVAYLDPPRLAPPADRKNVRLTL